MPIPNGHIIIRGFLKISESGITYMAALMSSIMLAILLITINLFTSYDNCFGVQEEIFFKDSPGAEKFLVESAETRNGNYKTTVKGLAAVGPNAKFKANAKQVIISSVQNLEVNVMENPVPSQGSSGSRRCSSPELRRNVSHFVEPPELSNIIRCIKCEKNRLLTLAGPTGSGKSVTLQHLVNRLETEGHPCANSFRHIFLRYNPGLESSKCRTGFSSTLATKLGCRFHEHEDPTVVVESELHQLTEKHGQLLLILDLSLIPMRCREILEFLYSLVQNTHLLNLKIIMSTLNSLKKCKQFLDLGDAAVEIQCQEFSKETASSLLKDINPKLTEIQIDLLLEHFGSSPCVLQRVAKPDVLDQHLKGTTGCFQMALKEEMESILDDLCHENEMEQSFRMVVNSLPASEKVILTQCLVFPGTFDLNMLVRILDSDILPSNCAKRLEFLGSKGLFLLNARITGKGFCIHSFSKVQRTLLCKVIFENEDLKDAFKRAEMKFCCQYIELCVFLGERFLGKKVCPSNAVECLLKAESVDSVNQVVKVFRWYQSEVIQSILSCRKYRDLHVNCITAITQTSVICLLSQLILPRCEVILYKTLERVAEEMKDELTVAKLAVCIASCRMNNYGLQRFTEEAKKLLQRALPVLEPYRQRADVADLYNYGLSKLGRCIVSEEFQESTGMKNAQEGITMMRRAAKFSTEKKEKTDMDHVLTAMHWQHIAGACHQVGNLEEAELVMKKRVRPVYQKVLNKHPFTAAGNNCLGVVLRKLGDRHFDEASKYLLEGLQVRQNLLGNHPDTMRSLHELALWNIQKAHNERKKGKSGDRYFEKAKGRLKSAVQMAVEGIGEPCMEDTAESLLKLAEVCRSLGQTVDSEKYEREGQVILKKTKTMRKCISFEISLPQTRGKRSRLSMYVKPLATTLCVLGTLSGLSLLFAIHDFSKWQIV